MKICTKCQRQLEDQAEVCECGNWFRLDNMKTLSPTHKAPMKMPTRLVVALALNLLASLSAFAALWRIAHTPRIETLGIVFNTWQGALLAILLMSACILVMLHKRRSNYFLLAVVIIYSSIIIWQNVVLLNSQNELASDHQGIAMLSANILRYLVLLAVTAWATISTKTRAFMRKEHA